MLDNSDVETGSVNPPAIAVKENRQQRNRKNKLDQKNDEEPNQ